MFFMIIRFTQSFINHQEKLSSLSRLRIDRAYDKSFGWWDDDRDGVDTIAFVFLKVCITKSDDECSDQGAYDEEKEKDTRGDLKPTTFDDHLT